MAGNVTGSSVSARIEFLCPTPYEKVRHPQYAGFLLVMVGFLLQRPTIPTLLMFPVLVVVYWRLAAPGKRGPRTLRERVDQVRGPHVSVLAEAKTPRRMTSPGPRRRALVLRSSHDDLQRADGITGSRYSMMGDMKR